MIKPSKRLFYLISVIFIVSLLVGSVFFFLDDGVVQEKYHKEGNSLGEPVFVQKSRGEFNSTRIIAKDFLVVNEIITEEENLVPAQGNEFLLVQIETGILIEKDQISLEINDKEINGTSSGNIDFKIKGNKTENFDDYIHSVESTKGLIGLYPGAELEGWVIFEINKDISLESAYIKLEPDVLDKEQIRWRIKK